MKTVHALFPTRFIPLYAVAGLALFSFIFARGNLALMALACGLLGIGIHDLIQKRHALLRNYPLLGHLRFLLEHVRPEIRQYFLEDDTEEHPFSRAQRSLVYQRAKGQTDKVPFGTQQNVYASGHEWLLHSLKPSTVDPKHLRVTIGGPRCRQPYAASLLNVSAMSFGAISANAIRALNKAASEGGFAQDTGEGGISPYHLEHGGDLIWEIGTGYFGCRNPDGSFSESKFAETAAHASVKMIEIKLSQGAKPGQGGILPGRKVNAEIAAVRGVPEGEDCISPSAHTAFQTPVELVLFIEKLRRLSHGKPVGFKLCIGQPEEFLAITKAMVTLSITPDFIVIDGAEGGTGAASSEFADSVGMPLREGLNFVHNALLGVGLRNQIKLGCSGKIITGFDMLRLLALGADWCNAARAFMFSLGCIQAKSCHTDHCPTGIATQDPIRQQAISVPHKAERVRNFQHSTLDSLAHLLSASGCQPGQRPPASAILRRISASEVKSYRDLYPELAANALLVNHVNWAFKAAWLACSEKSFAPVAPGPASPPQPMALPRAAALPA